MPFNPNIVVTEPGSSRVLIIAEARTDVSSSWSEPQFMRYMWQISCPIGLFVSPRSIVVYRNWFTGYSDDSVKKLGEFASPPSWGVFERSKPGAEFETNVQNWLERLGKDFGEAEMPAETSEALQEFVVPYLMNGEVHAAGPRLTR